MKYYIEPIKMSACCSQLKFTWCLMCCFCCLLLIYLYIVFFRITQDHSRKVILRLSLTFLKKSTTMVIPLLIGLALVGMSHGESGELFTMREAHQLKVLAKELVDRQKIGDLLTK